MKQSEHAKGRIPVATANQAGVLACAVFEYNLKAALAANEVIEMGALPANATLVDAILDTDDLDTHATAPTITLDVGLLSGTAGEDDDARTCGNEVFAASTVAQAGGAVRVTKQLRVAQTAADRGIGVKVAAAPAAGATTGKIRLTVFYVQL